MPLDPTLGELSDQQSMTHWPEQATPFQRFMDYAQQPAPPSPSAPWQEKINQALIKQDPRYVPSQPQQQQNWQQWVEQSLNFLPLGFLAGLNRPHAPIISGNPEKLALLEKLMKQNTPLNQMAKKLEVSEKSLRRHLNEAQGVRVRRKGLAWNDPKLIEQYKDMIDKGFTMEQMAEKLGTGISSVHDQLYRLSAEGHFDYAPKGGTRTPSMPSFDLPGEATGDPEYEKALADFLQGQQSSPARLPEINMPSLEELFDQLTTKRKP